MHTPFLLAAALLAVSPAWAANKCKGPDGTVVYQATACPESGELVGDEIARREAQNKAARKAAADQLKAAQESAAHSWAQFESDQRLQRQRRQQLCNDQFHDEPFVGMAEHAMKNCTRFWERYGAGAHVNETETARSVSRQYVFRVGGIKYLYTDGGKVTAIQR